MELSDVKEAALLSWVNGVCPEKPVWKILQIKDGQLRRFAYKVCGKMSCETLLVPPFSETIKIIFNILMDEFVFNRGQSAVISKKINEGIELDLQLAKVVLVLCYCDFKVNNMIPDLDVKTELMISSMFRFVRDDVDGLSLDECLDKFLTKDCVLHLSSSSECSINSSFCTGDESPFFGWFHGPPRDGDQLEKELANQISIIPEKEGILSQLQHRMDHLLQKIGEFEKGHDVYQLELQEKKECLLQRVHEIVKQCQDFKTSSSQKEIKINELREENATLAAQVQNAFAQLKRAEEEIAKLTLACEMSRSKWENELNEAVTQRALTKIESLQIKVLELTEQISSKDDEIRKLSNWNDSLNHEVKLVKDQNVEINEVIKSIRKDHEDTIRKLQQELRCAAFTASKKQEDIMVLSAEVTHLKEKICHYNENQHQKQLEFSVLEAEHKVLMENMTSLQSQLAEVKTMSAQKESELLLLQQQLCHQETQRKTTLELETARCEELEKTVSQLQAKVLEISSVASEREACLTSLQNEMKDQERLRAQLELKVEGQSVSILGLNDIAIKWKQQCKQLLETVKMMLEKINHYNYNKQQLVKAQEMNKSLMNSLEASRRDIEALKTELTLARMERDQEKDKVESLQTQVNLSVRRLQKQRRVNDDIDYPRVPFEWQDNSKFNGLLNSYSHLAPSGETSTPQKTPGSVKAKESVCSPPSSQYRRKLAAQHFRPVSTNLFRGNDVTATSSKTNELQENETKHAADDLMRIAELQARNKACLPHMKSSYPLESRHNMGIPSLTLTDEDLRMGSPQETIQLAASHLRSSQKMHSLHARNRFGSQRAATPEMNESTSCFSQTTVKGRHENMHPVCKAKQKQHVVFTIPNTPKPRRGGTLLHRGRIFKNSCKSATASSQILRSTLRKSPCSKPYVKKTSH
nr:nuclear mitotic apparatus protein 1-like [Misgurnus anguillicaudatus]